MSSLPMAGESWAEGVGMEFLGTSLTFLLFLGSIHPRDKQNVAHRLLLGARAVAYGDKDLVFQGPYPTRAILEVTRGLLNVTYSQELICRQRDAQAFEVRSGISSPKRSKGKAALTGVSPLPRCAAPARHPHASGCQHQWWQ